MIDFRYHLVSLVSVFLALAVGIVLGAGPLKGSLGDSLTRQVQGLREDRESLRADLGRAESSIEHRDEFLGAVTDRLVSDSLGGRSVVLVTLPGADEDTVGDSEDALRAAGATVAGRVDLTEAWTDPAGRSDREGLARALAAAAAVPGAPASPDLAEVLASVLLTEDLSDVGPLPVTASAALSRLREERLVRSDRLPTTTASSALVVAPPLAPDLDSDAISQRRGQAEVWRDVVAALDAAGDGVVVEGPASAAGAGGVVEAVRDADTRRSVSTVDTGTTAMGPLSVVLAMVEQVRGQTGHYGFADGATAPLPTEVSGAGS